MHAAGGGEIPGRRAGWRGGEFGLLAGPDSGVFMTSANGVLHFVPSVATPIRSRISPFVTGGYTRISSGEGGFDAWNIGAGADSG